MTPFRAAAVLAFAVLSASAQEKPFRIMPDPVLFAPAVNETIRAMRPSDAFEGLEACAVADARFAQPVSLGQVEQLLAPCLSALSAKYGAPVKLGRMAASQDGFAPQVEGLVLRVPSHLPVTHPLIRDLNAALNRRGGKLFGYPAAVRREDGTVSAAQAALDRCLMPTVLRKIESGEDFIGAYGRCLLEDAQLQIIELRPSPAHRLGVTVMSAAGGAVIRALNGSVSVVAENGPVELMVMAYPEFVFLP